MMLNTIKYNVLHMVSVDSIAHSVVNKLCTLIFLFCFRIYTTVQKQHALLKKERNPVDRQ